MKKLVLGVSTLFLLTHLTACTITKEQGGAATGAVVGGVVGSQIGGGSGQDVATGLGIIGGAIVGASLGRSFDQLDAMNTQRALESNKTNQTSSWVSPDSGNQYTLTPTSTYQASSSQYCREYQTSVTVGGKAQQGYGTACRQPDGQWQIQ